MYESIRQFGIVHFLAREAIPITLSLVIAELFYKFHSFTLEVLAFLATWYVLSAITSLVINRKDD
jgi:hypothetical protein